MSDVKCQELEISVGFEPLMEVPALFLCVLCSRLAVFLSMPVNSHCIISIKHRHVVSGSTEKL